MNEKLYNPHCSEWGDCEKRISEGCTCEKNMKAILIMFNKFLKDFNNNFCNRCTDIQKFIDDEISFLKSNLREEFIKEMINTEKEPSIKWKTHFAQVVKGGMDNGKQVYVLIDKNGTRIKESVNKEELDKLAAKLNICY